MIPCRHHQTILVSCEIPWDEREELLEDVFRQEIRHFLALGFRDLYIFGTAGEGYAVDARRFDAIVQVFRQEAAADDVTAMVGVIGLSTANIVERLTIAHEAGFRHFQISLPCWGALMTSRCSASSATFAARSLTVSFSTTICPAANAC